MSKVGLPMYQLALSNDALREKSDLPKVLNMFQDNLKKIEDSQL
jgi:hypothetical protein